MEIEHFDRQDLQPADNRPAVNRGWLWVKRGCALVFGLILLAHVAVMAICYPIIVHDRNMAKLKIGDTRETMVRLVGEPRWSKSVPQWGSVCEYTIFPRFMDEDYRNYRFRRRWRVVLDDSNRVVGIYKLDNYGC